jgi:nucleoside-diphosphate-sugar epimerase
MISLELLEDGDKILDVQDTANNIIKDKSILLSRNRPVAFIVGVAGFLGSHLSEKLIELGIQVVGVDNLSTADKLNLIKLIRDKNFHFINHSISDAVFSKSNLKSWQFPRLDYAFFTADSPHPQELYGPGLLNFLNLLNFLKEKNDLPANKPRIVLIS